MKHAIIALCALAFCACAPNLQQVQDTLSAYHVMADTEGGGKVAFNARMVAIHGEAGAKLTVTAPLSPDGKRGVVLARTMTEGGVLAWRVHVRSEDSTSWLRLERVPCIAARAELPELPVCGVEAAAVDDVVEVRIYPD